MEMNTKINLPGEGLFTKLPMAEATVIIRVEVTPSSMLTKLASELDLELIRILPQGWASRYEEVDFEYILKYLKTLQFMRVLNVNGELRGNYAAYAEIYNKVRVPVVMTHVIGGIGEAYDNDYAIKFVPTYQIDASDLLSVEEMMKVSDLFLRIKDMGFKTVEGIIRSREGILETMALQHIQGTVLGYKKSHPVFGFYASFFEQKQAHELIKGVQRIVYGYKTDYELILTEWLRVAQSGGGGHD